VSSVHDARKEPAAAAASRDLNGWTDRRSRRILLAGLLGYVGATAAGVAQHSHGADAVAGYAILAGFCSCFMAIATWPGRLYWLRAFWPLLGAMVALALTEMLFAQGDAFYLAAVVIVPLVGRLGRRAAGLVTVAALATLVVPLAVPSWHEGLGWGPAISVAFTALMVYAFVEIMTANRALHDAHLEIAQLASQAERSRIGRDLHDLLGHSLTAITVKAALARRLASSDQTGSVREITEVEELSRQALADVRAAVSEYRGVTLAGELVRGKELLRAVGVVAELPTTTDVADPSHDQLLGWAVREGITNVARHAHATHCSVTLTPAMVEISDDGVGGVASRGNGLNGLRERVATAGGTLEAGPIKPRGWRLRVSLDTSSGIRG
jgi:two-component system, NarL family, sensor histidine kinase DesK